MAKWGRGSKVPGYGRLLSKFDQSFSYSGGLIESCPKPGTFDPLPPFAIHILNPLDMRIHRDPLYMGQKCTQKCLETNTSQVLGNCGSFSPLPTKKNQAHKSTKSNATHQQGASPTVSRAGSCASDTRSESNTSDSSW